MPYPKKNDAPGLLKVRDLLKRVRNGDADAEHQLFNVLSGGIRFYISRRVPTAAFDQATHVVFAKIIESIRQNDVRDRQQLLGYMRAVLQVHLAALVERSTRMTNDPADRNNWLSELRSLAQQNTTIAVKILQDLSAKEREALIRFYQHGQSLEVISAELGLTESQLSEAKSRVKSLFEELRTRIPRRGIVGSTRGGLRRVG